VKEREEKERLEVARKEYHERVAAQAKVVERRDDQER